MALAVLSTQREVKVVKPCHSELHPEEWEGNRALLLTKLVTTFFLSPKQLLMLIFNPPTVVMQVNPPEKQTRTHSCCFRLSAARIMLVTTDFEDFDGSL